MATDDAVFAAALHDLQDGFFAPLIEHVGDDCVWQDRRSLFRLGDRRRRCQGIEMVRDTIGVSLGALVDSEDNPSIDLAEHTERGLHLVVRSEHGEPVMRVLCALDGSTITQITTTPSAAFARLKWVALRRGVTWFP